MSEGYKGTNINGDLTARRHLRSGGNLSVSGGATIKHTLKVEGWLDAPNIKGSHKGLYTTLAALKAAFPNPQNGWVAGVGTGTPYQAYTVVDGEWVPMGGIINIEPDTTATDQLREYVEDFEEFIQERTSKLENLVAEISLNDIDLNIDTDGKMAIVFGMSPTYYRVKNGIRSVGVLMMHSDSNMHQITQIFFTNATINAEGCFNASHNDRATYIYRRNYGSSGHAISANTTTWSAWERIDAIVEQWATNQRFCKGALVAHNGVLYKVAANVATTEPSAMNPDYTALVADATTLVAQERAERIWAVNQLASNASAARAQMENRLAALIRQEEADRLEADAQMENQLTALIRQEEADRLEADAQIVARVETAQATAEQMLPKSSIVVLTEDEYDALLVKNPDTYYLITEDD